jgi:hypothetical protein
MIFGNIFNCKGLASDSLQNRQSTSRRSGRHSYDRSILQQLPQKLLHFLSRAEKPEALDFPLKLDA